MGFPDHVPWTDFFLSAVNFKIKRIEKEKGVLPVINRMGGILQSIL